jgi:predicted transposase/invertase (TIGR01784 family)
MAHYLDPKNDLIFKRIFGEHPDLLTSFLNALMPFEPDRHIVTVEYLSPELVPENPGKKYSIVDVRCIDNYKRQFIIEMQLYWTDAFYNRVVFNAGKAYVRQLDKSEKFELLQPVYTLAILNQNFDHKTNNFYHHYQIVNKENTGEIIPGLEFVLIELEKFHPESIADRKMAVLWLRFLKEVNEKMRYLPPEMQDNKYINKAAELCEEWALTEDELYVYEKYWDNIRVEKTLVNAWKREGMEKGIAKGMEKGIAEGMEKGIAEGMEKGIAKGMEKGIAKGKVEGEAITLERIVVESKINGLSLEQIQSITKLPIKQISRILKQHNLL